MSDQASNPVRACRVKARYATEAIATSVAVRVLNERGTILRTYACEDCGGYHLTHTRVELPKPGWRPAKFSQRYEADRKAYGRRRGRRY